MALGFVAVAAWWHWTATASAGTPTTEAGPVDEAVDSLPSSLVGLVDLVDGLVGATLHQVTEPAAQILQPARPAVRDERAWGPGPTPPAARTTTPAAGLPGATRLTPTAPPPDTTSAGPERPMSLAASGTSAPAGRAGGRAGGSGEGESGQGGSGPGEAPGGWSGAPPESPPPPGPGPTPEPATAPATGAIGAIEGGRPTDRGPLLSGTPGAPAAIVAASTAAPRSAAVEALEDGPPVTPAITPD